MVKTKGMLHFPYTPEVPQETLLSSTYLKEKQIQRQSKQVSITQLQSNNRSSTIAESFRSSQVEKTPEEQLGNHLGIADRAYLNRFKS